MFRINQNIKAKANIVVMRHAETVWNAPRKRIQGQSPDDQIFLSANGRSEVLAMMSNVPLPDLLICSPLLRCKQTAEAWFKTAFDKITIPTIFMDGLKEVDAGELEGIYVDELKNEAKKIWELWKDSPLHFTGFPKGETLIAFQKRILTAFAEICTQYGNQPKNICILSHGGPLRILKCFLDNKDLSQLWEHEVSNLDRFELTEKDIIKLQNFLQKKTFPHLYEIGATNDDYGNAILVETKKFNVNIQRDNQSVPGILRLQPKEKRLSDWGNWQEDDWIELIQLQRLIEFTLINAFDKRNPQLKPTEDIKLINFFGKQRKTSDGIKIYFDIAPRYIKPVELQVKQETYLFTDDLFGKPFDFTAKKVVADNIYEKIVNTLRDTMKNTDFTQFKLNDDFAKKWDNCYSCKHPKDHPENVGLIQVGEYGTNLEFSMAFDSRSQEEKGRAFCDSDLHIPALRYWEDQRMVMMGELFKNHRHTVNEIYPSLEREFDIGILMNLAKAPEGTHTHGHFIPRTPGSVDYGTDFQMDAKKYIPLVKGKIERDKIVNRFAEKLVTELQKSSKLSILWARKKISPADEMKENHSVFGIKPSGK